MTPENGDDPTACKAAAQTPNINPGQDTAPPAASGAERGRLIHLAWEQQQAANKSDADDKSDDVSLTVDPKPSSTNPTVGAS